MNINFLSTNKANKLRTEGNAVSITDMVHNDCTLSFTENFNKGVMKIIKNYMKRISLNKWDGETELYVPFTLSELAQMLDVNDDECAHTLLTGVVNSGVIIEMCGVAESFPVFFEIIVKPMFDDEFNIAVEAKKENPYSTANMAAIALSPKFILTFALEQGDFSVFKEQFKFYKDIDNT